MLYGKKLKITSVIFMCALLLFALIDFSSIYASAENKNFEFVFHFEGDYANSSSITKLGYGSEAYAGCTSGEDSNANFTTWLMAYDEYDGNYDASYNRVTLWIGSEGFIQHSAKYGEITWLRSQLNDSSIAQEYGGVIMRGRWRPDTSIQN